MFYFVWLSIEIHLSITQTTNLFNPFIYATTKEFIDEKTLHHSDSVSDGLNISVYVNNFYWRKFHRKIMLICVKRLSPSPKIKHTINAITKIDEVHSICY